MIDIINGLILDLIFFMSASLSNSIRKCSMRNIAKSIKKFRYKQKKVMVLLLLLLFIRIMNSYFPVIIKNRFNLKLWKIKIHWQPR